MCKKKLNVNIIFQLLSLIFFINLNGQSKIIKSNEIIYGGGQYYFKPNQKNVTYLGSQRSIYKKNIITRETNIIYTGLGSQLYVKISSNRKYIGSIQYGIGGENRGYPQAINNLIILDSDGNLVHEINDNVRRFAWSPDGSKIVYITGEYREAKHYSVTGYYIFDIITGEKKQIEGIGVELNWAEFDNSIYFDGWKRIGDRRTIPMMYKWNSSNNKLEETEYKGINFSTDGEYYYRTPNEGRNFKLYESKTNRDITDKLLNFNLHPITIHSEWILNHILLINGANIIENGRPYKTIIYDIKNNKVLSESLGTPIMNYTANGISKIIMENETHTITGNQIETIQKIWND